MKIKYKILTMAVLSIIFLILTTYIMFNFAYFGYINISQKYQIAHSFDEINYILKDEQENMKSTAVDWSHWDDTYRFIMDSNKGYIESNLAYNSLKSLDLKMMLFLNAKGEIVYDNHFPLQDDIASSLIDKLLKEKSSLKKLMTFSTIHNVKTGLLRANGQTFMVAISPITTSDEKSAPNGALIIVREISNSFLDYIQKVTSVNIYFHGYLPKGSILDKKLDFFNLDLEKDNNKISSEGSRILKDINGNSSIVITVSKENSNYENVLYYFRTFIAGFLVIIAFICLVDVLIMRKYVLDRLSKLTLFMNRVADTKDTTLSLNMSGHDEFKKLADTVNSMLAGLNSAYTNIKNMNERFKMIMESTNDGYMDLNVPEEKLYISPEWGEMIGYPTTDNFVTFHDYVSRIHPACYEHLDTLFPSIINGESDYFKVEYRILTKTNEVLWVLHRGKIVEKDSNGGPIRIVSTLTNITERKAHEEEILFLSYSDKLTGLRNRAYMENLFDELDSQEDSRYFIITGDLNGLKLTNDAFGHKEGDRLLRIISSILKESASDQDVVSRWGGDEFVILVKNQDSAYVSHLVDTIKTACTNTAEFHFKISIALGYAAKDSSHPDTGAVMSLAEKRMYRNKLMEHKSARSATINSLSRTLHEKHSETEQHTMRIRNLSLKLGKRLNLSQDQLDELELLALLHDIGKIGIPDHILMKPGKLTDEEWQIMKTHTDIGYRIAQSTPELSHIADEILAHHERYDGTGYPNRLKGEEIPILSRIINIIDSFDVMTHKRVYKEASDFEYAMNELKRCSGTQFDPFITQEFISLLNENNNILSTISDAG